MTRSDASIFHTFQTSAWRYGRLQAPWLLGVPYLPYLPYLIPPAYTGGRAHAYTRACVSRFSVWKVWKVWKAAPDKAFRVPYLFHTSARYGT
jgi:hypothetical protein